MMDDVRYGCLLWMALVLVSWATVIAALWVGTRIAG